MNKLIAIIGIIALFPVSANAATSHSGRIYLQVESHGEAWYVNPVNGNRYYLGKPDDAYQIMRTLGLGITDANLDQIPVGLLDNNNYDSDDDGLSDDLEVGLGTDPSSADSDGDDYSDKTEIENWYDPNGDGALPQNAALRSRLSGRILLQVEKHGEAWYINPANNKRYYLGRAADAFNIMRQLGIGITNANLNTIVESYTPKTISSANHYSVSIPSTWVKVADDDPLKTYMGLPVVDYATYKVPGESAFMKLTVIIPNSDKALSDLTRKSRTGANAPVNKNIIVDSKPGLRQYFKYPQPVTNEDDVVINKGAEFYVNLMLSTRKFVHVYLAVPEESKIDRYSKTLDQIVGSMKLYE